MSAHKRFSVAISPLVLLFHYVAAAAVGITLLVGIFRYFVVDWFDPYRCGALLKDGQWLDDKFNNWQPNGCMMHNYAQKDVSTCLASRRVVFVGDSVTRQLFFTVAHIADPDLPLRPPNDAQKHSDYTLTSKDHTEFSFIWDPFLNSSKTRNILRLTDQSGTISTHPSIREPAMLVFGTGLWFLRHPMTSGGLSRWEITVESALDLITRAQARLADAVVLLPIEEVVSSKLSPARASTIRNSDVNVMNSDLKYRIEPPSTESILAPLGNFGNPSRSSGVAFPQAFNRMLAPSQTADGLHYSEKILKAQANILLNYRCNDVLPKDFPLDKTCCRKYPSVSFHQISVLLLLASWGLIARWVNPKLPQRPLLRAIFPGDDHINPLSTFGLAILLIFIADRTPIWLKEQKQYDPWVFGSWCTFGIVAGFLWIKKADQDLGFLNREQTDEWKGWMQIAILIYHYCGASKISGIYNPIRVLVAAYLFMSGYGHTTFYIKKADYGLLRVAQVLVRLNLLPITLAYTMNTNYLSYYFSPLVSMWFLIIYATMVVGKSFNDRSPFLIIKILASMAIVTRIMSHEWILKNIFRLLETLCGIRWSAREWDFRVKLDLWIVYFGMLAALAYIKFRELGIINHNYWPSVHRATIVASSLVLMWFFYFELTQPSKFIYNTWHPYISVLPIGAFVILRNANATLRSTSSRVFAFIGTCSLETFIIQFHFWLAADTKGLLLVIPGTDRRPLNLLITTTMFIWLSHKVAAATGELTNWFCGVSKKVLPTATPSGNLPEVSSSRSEEVPLTERHKDALSEADVPDTAAPTQRWVERLATGPVGRPGYRLFLGNDSWHSKWDIGVGTKLVISALVLWIVNITWPT